MKIHMPDITAECEAARRRARVGIVDELRRSIDHWASAEPDLVHVAARAGSREHVRLQRIMLAAVEADLPIGGSS